MLEKFRIWLRYIWLISSRKAVKWYEKATLTEHFFMIIMAIIIGIIGGLGAVFVRWLIEELSLIFFFWRRLYLRENFKYTLVIDIVYTNYRWVISRFNF